MNLEIFANYGVLAHEYQTIYTCTAPHVHAAASDRVVVEIPDELIAGRNYLDILLIKIPGEAWPCPLPDMLASWGGRPCLIWYDGHTTHRKMLSVINGEK